MPIVPMTVNTPDAGGVAITFELLGFERYIAGDHKYEFAPLTVSVTDCP